MQNIEIKLLAADGIEKDSPEAKDNHINVIVQSVKDGVGSVNVRTETINGGPEGTVIRIRDNERIVIETKQATEELVWDRENSAAVRKSSQSNEVGKADTAKQREVDELAERDRQEAAKKARGEDTGTQKDNRQQDSGGPVTVSGKQTAAPVANNPAGARQSGPGNHGPGPAGPQTVQPVKPVEGQKQGEDKK